MDYVYVVEVGDYEARDVWSAHLTLEGAKAEFREADWHDDGDGGAWTNSALASDGRRESVAIHRLPVT